MDARFDIFADEISAAFAKRFANAAQVLDRSPLPLTTRRLVEIRVSQINGCAFCTDMHTKDAAADGESATRLHLVAVWPEATVFTEAERAALAFAEESTRIADAATGVSDATWARLREHHDDTEVATLVCLVTMMNAANRFNVIARTPAGSYEPGMLAAALS